MSEKIANPKTTTPPLKTELTVRKATTKKAPVRAAVTETPKAAVQQEKKAKKTRTTGGKTKVVRDSFNMPHSDYAKIGTLKQLCLKNGMQVKKSQLLRAGLHALEKLSPAQLKIALSSLDKPTEKKPDSGK